jgi:hypothetical protein
MSIKLAILKSGEDVIADIQEMIIGNPEEPENQKVVGYFFNKPCVVKMRTTEESENKSYQINLFPWIPLSKDTKVPVINDWVITLVEPVDTLKKMYENDVLKNGKDN